MDGLYWLLQVNKLLVGIVTIGVVLAWYIFLLWLVDWARDGRFWRDVVGMAYVGGSAYLLGHFLT